MANIEFPFRCKSPAQKYNCLIKPIMYKQVILTSQNPFQPAEKSKEIHEKLRKKLEETSDHGDLGVFK